jgi:hypothetical protein
VERIGGRPVEQIRQWTAAEARYKAGGHDLAVYEISPPKVGYFVSIATDAPTPVFRNHRYGTGSTPGRAGPWRDLVPECRASASKPR